MLKLSETLLVFLNELFRPSYLIQSIDLFRINERSELFKKKMIVLVKRKYHCQINNKCGDYYHKKSQPTIDI